MHYWNCDAEMLCKLFPELLGENYSPKTMQTIREDPKSWLNSLPMVEYAHVLTMLTAHNQGGEPTKYIKILHNKLMMPILMRYYQELEWYRFMRATFMRQYWSMHKIAPPESHINLRTKLGLCTARVRRILRHICYDYGELKNFEIDSQRITNYMTEIQAWVDIGELGSWHDYLASVISKYSDEETSQQQG